MRIRVLATALAISCPGWTQTNETGFSVHFRRQDAQGLARQRQDGPQRRQQATNGGQWVVEDGAIIGSQDIPGNGGIVITDEQFGDFEVALEMNNDFGPDSGLFLRSTEDGKAYQAMIDYHAGGNLMGVYGEGLGGKPACGISISRTRSPRFDP